MFANVTVDSGFTADDALRYFDALRGDHPTVTLTLPTDPSGPSGLMLASGAQPILNALNGRWQVASAQVTPPRPATAIPVPTSC